MPKKIGKSEKKGKEKKVITGKDIIVDTALSTKEDPKKEWYPPDPDFDDMDVIKTREETTREVISDIEALNGIDENGNLKVRKSIDNKGQEKLDSDIEGSPELEKSVDELPVTKQDQYQYPSPQELIDLGVIICPKCGRRAKKVVTNYECSSGCEVKIQVKGADEKQLSVPLDTKPKVPMIEVEKVVAFIDDWERLNSIRRVNVLESYKETDDPLIRAIKNCMPVVMEYIENNPLPAPVVKVGCDEN